MGLSRPSRPGVQSGSLLQLLDLSTNPAVCRRQGLAVAKPFPLAAGPSPFRSHVLLSGLASCFLVPRSITQSRVLLSRIVQNASDSEWF